MNSFLFIDAFICDLMQSKILIVRNWQRLFLILSTSVYVRVRNALAVLLKSLYALSAYKES